MIEPSLQLGGGNWANKSDSLLGYHKNGANFYADELTFSRNSLASYTDANGLIQSMPYNLLQQSNTFGVSPWNITDGTTTRGQSSYDGTLNATLFDVSVAGGNIRQDISAIGVNNFSIYAKKGTANGIRIRFDQDSDTNLYIDLTDGSVFTSGNTLSINVDSVGNGWYKIDFSFEAVGLNLFRIIITDGTTTLSTGSIYIQDAQLNSGATAKPYFATTTRLNLARVDYKDNINGSLLLEPQRTNLVTYSEQMDNAAWNKTNATVTANATTSPDGTTNADKLVETVASGEHAIARVGGMASAGTYSLSVYAKASERTRIAIGNSSAGHYAIFDLSLGTIVQASQGTVTNGAISLIGANGFYRVSCTITVASAASAVLNLVSTGTTISYTGNGTSGIFVWGASLEAGSYSTSYIKSEGAATTRLADSCSKTGISDKIGQTEGTLFVEFDAIDVSDSRITISDGTSINRLIFRIHSNGTFQWEGVQSGADQWNIQSSSGTIVSGSTYKIAATYGTNDVALYINGTQIGVDNSAVVTSALNAIKFANASTGTLYHWNQYTKQALLFKTRLSNAELAALTTL